MAMRMLIRYGGLRGRLVLRVRVQSCACTRLKGNSNGELTEQYLYCNVRENKRILPRPRPQLTATARLMLPLPLLLLMAATSSCWMVRPVAGALGGCSYGYTSKSIAQAYLECLQYLNISRQPLDAFDETDAGAGAAAAAAAGNCLVRCIGLTTRWWDDERGVLEPALLPHFRLTASHHSNSPAAAQLVAQARQCVAVSSGPRTDANRCRAAYRSYRCYSDLLGELVAHPRFLPPRADELLGAVSDCAQVLQLPEQRVARYVASSFLRDADGTRLLRCIVLKLGLYSDGKGVLSERLVLLPGRVVPAATNGADPAGPLGKAQQCETSVRDLGVDVCHLAAHSIEHCYGREAFGELWPLMMHRYVPEGTVQQQSNVQTRPTTPDTSRTSDPPAAVRSKLVYLRKHEELDGTGGAVPFEMVIADTDYREIARLLDGEGDQPTPPKVGEGEESSSPELELQEGESGTELSEDTGELPLATVQEQARKPRSDSTTGDDCGRDRCPDRSTL